MDGMRLVDRLKGLRTPRFGEAHREGASTLEVSGLSVRYGARYALQDVSFDLGKGERVAVVGPNGAGKSTLFRVIAGVEQPSSGAVKVYGNQPGQHVCIAYLPQRSQVDWHFPVNVTEAVMMGRVGRIGYLHNPSTEDWRHVRQCLAVVGMSNLADRQIGELSGGQQQRMFIARALAQEADLMLMDEPLTGLDTPAQEEIFSILDELRQQQVTVLVATHDLNQAAERFDKIMLLNTRLLGFGSAEEIYTRDRLLQAYGGHLRLVETEDGVLVLSDICCDEDGN